MPIILVRHAERVDYTAPGWTARAARPFDSPITGLGLAQALQAGHSIHHLLKKHSLPPVKRVFCSPAIRCVQTATQICKALGVGRLQRAPALTETPCEAWYKSWAFRGISDSRWGGPEGFEWGSLSKEDLQKRLSPLASQPVLDLYLDHKAAAEAIAQLDKAAGRGGGGGGGEECKHAEIEYTSAALGAADSPHAAAEERLRGVRYGSYEEHGDTGKRVGEFARSVDEASATFVLVSHGGPIGCGFRELTTTEEEPKVGYTGIFVLKRDEEEQAAAAAGSSSNNRYKALVAGDLGHLEVALERHEKQASTARTSSQVPGGGSNDHKAVQSPLVEQ